ncbi:MAG: zinc-binding dehydrogenase, partial [Pseudomonadota bacterium]
VTYGNASGPVEPLAPTELVIRGSLNMTRPSLFSFLDTDAARRAAASALFGALRSGTIKPHIGQRFALDQVGDAHRAIEGGKTIGSTVLIP